MQNSIGFFTITFEDTNRFTNEKVIKTWTTTAANQEDALRIFNYITPPYQIKRKVKSVSQF